MRMGTLRLGSTLEGTVAGALNAGVVRGVCEPYGYGSLASDRCERTERQPVRRITTSMSKIVSRATFRLIVLTIVSNANHTTSPGRHQTNACLFVTVEDRFCDTWTLTRRLHAVSYT